MGFSKTNQKSVMKMKYFTWICTEESIFSSTEY